MSSKMTLIDFQENMMTSGKEKDMKFKKMEKIVFGILKYFTLIFFSFMALLPIVSCVITAFKNDEE